MSTRKIISSIDDEPIEFGEALREITPSTFFGFMFFFHSDDDPKPRQRYKYILQGEAITDEASHSIIDNAVVVIFEKETQAQ